LTHKQFQAAVEELAHRMGWLCYHVWNSRHSPAGFPDEVMVRPPRLVFAELKIPPDKPTVAQDVWLNTLAQLPGSEVFVWEPDEFEEIIEVLKR
jgi:hypothetical protein